MSTFGLVASSNGLGHARRLSNLALGFHSLGYSVNLFISTHQLLKIRSEFKFPTNSIKIFIIDSHGIDGPVWQKNGFKYVEPNMEIITEISKCDIIISDNVIWPIKYNENFYLFGHFSWIDYWENQKSVVFTKRVMKIYENEYLLMNKIKKWFLTEDFQLNVEAKRNIRIVPVKLLRYFNDNLIPDKYYPEPTIWISYGTTKLQDPAINYKNLMPYFNVKFLETFQLTTSNFKPNLVIGRPGLGTIRDCLAAGIYFYSVSSEDDLELISNRKSLSKFSQDNLNELTFDRFTEKLKMNIHSLDGFLSWDYAWSDISQNYVEVCESILRNLIPTSKI